MKYKKILAVFLTLLTALTVFSLSAYALTWDGDSAGGSTNAVNGSSTGYVIRSTNDSNCVVGYRFSVVNESGGMKVNKVIDVYRNTSNGNNAYSNSAKFSVKYNKKQLIANKNAKLTTTENITNCYKESGMKFLSSLPNPSEVEAWQAYEANINKVLTKIGIGTTSNMVYGDKVIIEPLFDICLAGEYQALTVSEIAYCGRSVLGGSSDGGKTKGNSSTWGFIANYTNRIWPNKLFTPNGQGLWDGVSAIGSSTKATFNTILAKGYGAGIAYNETARQKLTIAYDCYGSNVKIDTSDGYTLGNNNRLCSKTKNNKTIGGTTHVYYQEYSYNLAIGGNGLHNFSTFGLTAPKGYTFAGWGCGNKIFDETTTTYKPTDFTGDIKTGDAQVWLSAKFKPIKYTVKYNANGGTGTTSSSSHTYDAAKKLTANGFSRSGYSFNGWNTKSDGTGTSYTNKQSVKNLSSTNGATVKLYAKWKPNTYTVTYNANGGTGAPGKQTKTYGVDLTLSSIKPERTGYKFNGWNTKADASGTNYASGGKYTGNANLTLYAKWKPSNYTVTYNANGGTGAPGNQTKTYGVDLTLSSAKPTRTGYTFSKWNTKADGSGTNYNSGTKYTKNSNLKLYAQWTSIKYTVSYNANGGSGAPGNQTKTYGVDLTLSSTKPTRTGYIFNGWNTNSSGTGTNYASGGTYSSNKNVTLYAKWTPITYTIKYNGNGNAGGATASSSHTYDVAKALTTNNFTKTGYIFRSWNTKADGSGTSYADKQTVKNLTTVNGATINLYAQWAPITYTIRFNGNGSTGGSTVSMNMTYDEAKKLTTNGFTKDAHSFICWSIEKDGQGACYADKQLVKNMATVNDAVITLYAQWQPDRKLSLEAITPNAAYRERTEVVTSFNLINKSNIDCVPDDNISVRFTVYKDSNVIKTVILNRVVVPGNEKNLLYFKWMIPENIADSTISISGEIIENGSSYGLVKKSYSTCKYTISATPDTQYEISAPSGFARPPVPASSNSTKTWNVYSYENGAFKKTSYGIGFSTDTPKIVPAASANATQSNGVWTMKSGYGIEMNFANEVKSVSGYTMPSANSYTLSQYVIAKFPEFSYLNTVNKYRTLELVSDKWVFRSNGSYGRLHFTPLWYLDGVYMVAVEQSDLWTPAGMITRKVNTNSITIKGSAYDDWYVG